MATAVGVWRTEKDQRWPEESCGDVSCLVPLLIRAPFEDRSNCKYRQCVPPLLLRALILRHCSILLSYISHSGPLALLI